MHYSNEDESFNKNKKTPSAHQGLVCQIRRFTATHTSQVRQLVCPDSMTYCHVSSEHLIYSHQNQTLSAAQIVNQTWIDLNVAAANFPQ